MLSKKVRKRIKEHKWNDHSNTSQFFNRLENQADAAIKDLTLIIKEVEEEQRQAIFTTKRFEPLIEALVTSGKNNDRKFFIGHLLLTWALNHTGSTINNRWAKKMYSEHEVELRNILDSIHHEKQKQSLENY